jgi:hypothetical protein
MGQTGATIRKLVKQLEAEAGPVAELRDWAKYETKLTPFGAALVDAAKEHEVPQSVVARLLDVSPSAINRRYNA